MLFRHVDGAVVQFYDFKVVYSGILCKYLDRFTGVILFLNLTFLPLISSDFSKKD